MTTSGGVAVKESKSNVHERRGGQKNRKEMTTSGVVAKRIKKKCPRTAWWPKESKRNDHERRGGQKNQKEMSTNSVVAKRIEKK